MYLTMWQGLPTNHIGLDEKPKVMIFLTEEEFRKAFFLSIWEHKIIYFIDFFTALVKEEAVNGASNTRPVIYLFTASGQEQAAFKVSIYISFS